MYRIIFASIFLHLLSFVKSAFSITKCSFYPPNSTNISYTSCSASCCRNIAHNSIDACCTALSSISISYVILFGILLGCCSIFSIIGFIISCCKYGYCDNFRLRVQRASIQSEMEEVDNRNNVFVIDKPPSYGEIMPKPKNDAANNNNILFSSTITYDKSSMTPPPPYRINVLPANN